MAGSLNNNIIIIDIVYWLIPKMSDSGLKQLSIFLVERESTVYVCFGDLKKAFDKSNNY